MNLENADGREWQVNHILFADDRALVDNSEAKLHQLVNEFGRIYRRRKLRMNVRKSKVMRCRRGIDGVRMGRIWQR